MSSDSCDRCRRLDKKCRARESVIKEEEQRNIGHDTVMQGNDLSGVSQSTASAALALTALSFGSGGGEDRKMEQVIKHSPPFIPPLPPPNVYQLPGSILLNFQLISEPEYKQPRQPISRQPSTLYQFPESSLDKANSLKRKLPKKCPPRIAILT